LGRTLTRKEAFTFTSLGFFFFLLMALWLGFGERGFIHLYGMEKERQDFAQKIQKLEQENMDLLEEINRLRSDRQYIESQGRRELGLVKEGEILYRFKKEKELKE